MEKAKEHIDEAIKELKTVKCECDKHITCDRCIAIFRLTQIKNFLLK